MPTIATPDILKDILLLLARLLVAVAFFHESRIKFKDLKQFAESHDLSLGLARVVALVELLAAISMFLGLLIQWSSLGLVLLMLITTSMQIFKWHNAYWANKSGWEYDLIMLTFGALIFAWGPGRWALDVLF